MSTTSHHQSNQLWNAEYFDSPYKPVVVLQINDLCEWLRFDFATEKHGKIPCFLCFSVAL